MDATKVCAKHVVYALCHPITGDIRYVGCTCDLVSRVECHLNCRRTPVGAWIESLASRGQWPRVAVLQECKDRPSALVAEGEWIAKCTADGCKLLNNNKVPGLVKYRAPVIRRPMSKERLAIRQHRLAKWEAKQVKLASKRLAPAGNGGVE